MYNIISDKTSKLVTLNDEVWEGTLEEALSVMKHYGIEMKEGFMPIHVNAPYHPNNKS